MTPKFDIFIKFILIEQQDFSDLNPERPPYGFWIFPDGRYQVVSSHGVAAKNIINNNPKYSEIFKDGISDLSQYSEFLLKNNFVRVIIDHSDETIYYSNGVWNNRDKKYDRIPVTTNALRTIKDLSNFYDYSKIPTV